jgi:hypothetical protein
VVAVAADTVSGRAKPPGDSSRGKRFPIQYVFLDLFVSFAVHLVRQPADVEGILNLRKLDIIVFHRRMSGFTGYLNGSCSAAFAVPNLLCSVSVYVMRGRREGGGRRGEI